MILKYASRVWLAFLVLVVLFMAQITAQDDAVTIVVEMKSHPHEIQSGYFNFGDETALHAKPGSKLFIWMERHKEHKIKLTLQEETDRTLMTLGR